MSEISFKDSLVSCFATDEFSNVESLHYFEEIDSTMEAAKKCLKEELTVDSLVESREVGSNSMKLFVADEQTSGRGRGGSSWYSPAKQGLYCSLLVRPQRPIEEVLGVSIVAGIAICRALRTCGAECGIKWPNDIVLDTQDCDGFKKLAGILVESSIQDGSAQSLIVGFGVNVGNETFPIDVPGGSLKNSTGIEFERSRVLLEIIGEFSRLYKKLLGQGFSSIIPQWSEHSVLLGADVSIACDDGSLVEGKVTNLNAQGALLIQEIAGKDAIAVHGGEFREIRFSATSGTSVRQSFESLLSETQHLGDADEIRKEFEDSDSLTPEMLDDACADSGNLSTLIKDMSLAEKTKLGMLGNMSARSLLIRDTNRLVRAAVMKNPRLSDNEVIEFAKNPNLEEQVSRLIVRNKTWMKMYAIKVAIVTNPKTPLDISVKWLKHLQDRDLKILSKSKNVPSALVNQCRKLIRVRTKK